MTVDQKEDLQKELWVLLDKYQIREAVFAARILENGELFLMTGGQPHSQNTVAALTSKMSEHAKLTTIALIANPRNL
ncbi:hypothetical protein GCM10028806_33160 [Spirosoma terrae]|uniref:Uncharacterized protein n=1 Tax=Spirosoma terrae TaxID=1968276 RepID=A0A6L9L5G6_9BACT|nr:hypothetical protein [Spirosoma terrae]NDU95630.1 hypothetical protein [Spirosoma terrae]